MLISARRNRLIVEERLPIPVTRRQLIQKEEEVENRWVFGIDNRDRDGFFVGRNLKPIELIAISLTLEPQFMVQPHGEMVQLSAPSNRPTVKMSTSPPRSATCSALKLNSKARSGVGTPL